MCAGNMQGATSSEHVTSVLESLHARLTALEARDGDYSPSHSHGTTDMVYESKEWPVLHELTVKYRDPLQKESLGLNGHWSIGDENAPHVYGGGTLDGKRWSLSFSEHRPTQVTVEGCFHRGDQCLTWDSGVVWTVADLVLELNKKFHG